MQTILPGIAMHKGLLKTLVNYDFPSKEFTKFTNTFEFALQMHLLEKLDCFSDYYSS